MNIDSGIISYLKTYFDFNYTNLDILNTVFELENRRKKSHLVERGMDVDEIYLIIDGYVRTYHLSDQGKRITTEIYSKGEMVTSIESLLKKNPSLDYIQCISDCKFYKTSNKIFNEINNKDPYWYRLGLNVLKADLLKKEKRINNFTKLNATKRYQELLKDKSDVIKNVPVQYLASYIGVKPESLSRIRSTFSNF